MLCELYGVPFLAFSPTGSLSLRKKALRYESAFSKLFLKKRAFVAMILLKYYNF